jgi:hypothetical protein
MDSITPDVVVVELPRKEKRPIDYRYELIIWGVLSECVRTLCGLTEIILIAANRFGRHI